MEVHAPMVAKKNVNQGSFIILRVGEDEKESLLQLLIMIEKRKQSQ